VSASTAMTTEGSRPEQFSARYVVVITGASSGIGELTARELSSSGHTVYAGIRDCSGKNADVVRTFERDAAATGVDLRTVELDVTSDASVRSAVERIIDEAGHIDVLVHNAGHMVLGPSEAFTPEQCMALYDTNVMGAQRLNRAALPAMRQRGSGLVVWVGSTSTRGGCPPFLGPYFAAKAAGDALAVSYAAELIRFGIDTTLVIPGAFTSGTNHFANAGHPDDEAVARAYDARYGQLMNEVDERLAGLLPPDADVADVAREIRRIVELPPGQRPLRTTIDPSQDGSEVVTTVGDRIRVEFFRRVGLDDLLTPHSSR
jgi:NAD(P)-dependent dehydrogenase (short-subunit alcohol dehydrogenase family)